MKVVTSLDQLSREEQLSWLGHNYAIDVETEGLDFIHHQLIGVALYVNGESYYFVRKHTLDDGQTIQDYLTDHEIGLILGPIMSQTECVVCLHNAKFDLHYFERFDLPLSSRVFDTLMAAKLLNEDRQNGLKDLAHLVTDNLDHVKYEQLAVYGNFPKGCPYNVPLQPFAEYACKDVIVTYKLYEKFKDELAHSSWRGRSLQQVFNEIWSPMIPTLMEMEQRGFRIDLEQTQVLYDEYSEKLRQYEKEVLVEGLKMLVEMEPEEIPPYYWQMLEEDDETYLNEFDQPVLDIEGIQTRVWQPTPRSKFRKLHFNIGSNSQLSDLLYRRDLGLPSHVELKTTKGGEDSVDVDNLKVISHYLKEDTPHYVKVVLEWRKASKFVNTYLKMFLESVDENGALHGLFNMAASEHGRGGTRTGRLSSSNPNLQQIPSRGEIGSQARDLFIAREGHELIVADYSNMETVIMAHYSEDPMLLKAFEDNLDVHSLTASSQHNIDYETFVAEYKNGNPQFDQWRRTAKTILFGTAYGMGPKKLQLRLLVENGQEYEIDEVYKMLRAFDTTYQGLTDWKERVTLFVAENGFVYTMYGRKRRLPLAFSRDRQIRSRAQRQGVNAIVQGTCADILFEAMPPIQSFFKSLGGGLIASVHDELIGELAVEYAQAGAKVMQDTMVGLVNPKLKCKLKAEAHVGRTWKEAKG